ncbi:aminodeoxychorismate synthase component I [uncultured Sphingomonas sp.]|uniref:aminodeoxychorismate synthase component I n=1 Tax=uncultured Sphingomonas sp. TaxID=158754 RepID=UPI0025D1C61F|nr:aminodeoxychorismate synthase component I [uncultured Sphingomonas sp.]
MLRAGSPFVLLDDARPGGRRMLFRDPVEIVAAYEPAEVRDSLGRVRAAVAAGHHAAGWLAYEAGHALEARLGGLSEPAGRPLLWFGLFAGHQPFDPDSLPDAAGAWAGAPRPQVTRAEYDRAIRQVLDWIAAGDIYQANLSFRAAVRIHGDPLALYARLRAAGGAGWGGIVHDGRDWLLSFSPELFFALEDRHVLTRPMKGTRVRHADPAEDRAAAAELAAATKDRAENLMIVDLLRNDLARVARPGSVRVPALFAVEHYPTVHQMVSEVTAELAPGRDAVDVLEALFPCGSVTGAPKVRAMEIIHAVEADRRGAYTGSVGYISPGGRAAFNVAIRTLVLEEGSDEARIGLGSAVVADSTAEQEWAECLAKGAFVTAPNRPFDLIETMRFDPLDGLVNLEAHVARLGASASRFDFQFNRHDVRNELHAATFRLTEFARVRLRLSPSGSVAIETSALPPVANGSVGVRVVPLPVAAEDFRLRHKTSDRSFYDEARAVAGTFEVVFVRPDGQLTEGSFTSIFVARDGRYLTPPIASGLLPGVHRALMIERGEAVEAALTAADLCGGFFLGNDVRGMMPAHLV